jgi:hypothetical protein
MTLTSGTGPDSDYRLASWSSEPNSDSIPGASAGRAPNAQDARGGRALRGWRRDPCPERQAPYQPGRRPSCIPSRRLGSWSAAVRRSHPALRSSSGGEKTFVRIGKRLDFVGLSRASYRSGGRCSSNRWLFWPKGPEAAHPVL